MAIAFGTVQSWLRHRAAARLAPPGFNHYRKEGSVMAEATIHDYTRQRWGWALHSPEVVEYSEEPTLWERLWGRKERSGMYLSCMGHGKGIRPGHHLRVAMISGRVAQYRVDEIEYFSNPRDMFHIKRAEWVSYGSLPNPLDLETRG